jgi:hypothetical protein
MADRPRNRQEIDKKKLLFFKPTKTDDFFQSQNQSRSRPTSKSQSRWALLYGNIWWIPWQIVPTFLTTGYYFGLFFTLSHNFKGVHMVDDTSPASNRQGNKNSFLYKQEGDSTTTADNCLPIAYRLSSKIIHQFPCPTHCHMCNFGFITITAQLHMWLVDSSIKTHQPRLCLILENVPPPPRSRRPPTSAAGGWISYMGASTTRLSTTSSPGCRTCTTQQLRLWSGQFSPLVKIVTIFL